MQANGTYYNGYVGNCGSTPYGNPDYRGSSIPGFFCPVGYQSIFLPGWGLSCQSSKFYSPKTPPICKNGCCADNPILIGNPIEASLGTKSQNEIDYVSNGLSLDRTYISSGVFSPINIVGKNWRFGFDRRLSFNYPSEIMASRPNGTYLAFELVNNAWVPDADIADKLKENIGGGWNYFDANTNSTENYDANGFLTSIITHSARTTTFSNNGGGAIQTITDNFGRQITFIYSTAGNVSQIILPDGGIVIYSYDTSGNLKTVTYPDDTPADLTDNPKKTYVYGSDTGETANTAGVLQPNALTGIIDENGVRYATYQYDASGKAISTEHATGGIEKYSLAYAPDGSSTAVTDPLGAIRTTHFTTVLGVVKSTGSDQPGGSGCAASASAITYDANGNVASRTDFNGHRTNYTYDLTRNLETSRTEGLTATGATTPQTRIISTEWHPSFRLPTKTTEPGLETTYSYDSKGNTTHKSLKDLVTNKVRAWDTTYTYSASGILVQKVEDGPRTDVSDLVAYDYYPEDAACTGGHLGCRGQLKQVANALGHTTRITRYSPHGLPEIAVDPNGLTMTMAYDVRQRLLSMDVGGETTTYSYDPAGLLTRTTQPNGAYLAYRYDNAHRLIEVKDQLGNTRSYTLDTMGNRTKEDLTDPNSQLARSQTKVYDALSRLQNLVLPQ